jgi:hypothetical protein
LLVLLFKIDCFFSMLSLGMDCCMRNWLIRGVFQGFLRNLP